MSVETRRHVCTLCEAGCGLLVDFDAGRPIAVRGDDDDVLSRGFVCPKGLATLELDGDRDRLRTPVKRTPSGEFEPISWDEAFELAASSLGGVRERHGRDAVAAYLGTPVFHKHGSSILRGALMGALGTRNATSAGSQDTTPRFVASHYLYGSCFSVPVPDVDRTDYFLCIGANPLVSNGSMMTAPGVRDRLRRLLERGGKLVVVDPRRTETAKMATEHVAIRPGTDTAFLLGLCSVLLAEALVDERRLWRTTRGWAELRAVLPRWRPERVAVHTGVPAATIRRIARELATAPTSVAYSRIGVCNSEHGTLASFATDLVNLLAGRLGAVGGAMFPQPAVDIPLLARLTGSDGHARWHSRVRGLPETAGDLPASVLAEEMETPGEGQVRAFITVAGNPVLSTPNGPRLARALGGLEAMVSIDYYINETTRFARVILPPAGPLADDHVDLFFQHFAVHDGIRWVPPAVPRGPDERLDWEILLELAYRLGGGPTGMAPVDALMRIARRFGRRDTPDETIDVAVRLGPYGDRFLPWSDGLNGAKIRAATHGVDLGPMKAGSARRVRHRDGNVDIAPPPLLSALAHYERTLDAPRDPDELLLVGRRDIRSNNSWMHNLPALASGKDRCVLFVHPDDAVRLGLETGARATLSSHVHDGPVTVRVTDDILPGVVSLPHGHGHAAPGARLGVAGAQPGVSANDWTDDQHVEAISGNSILNGIRVSLRPDRATPSAQRTGG